MKEALRCLFLNFCHYDINQEKEAFLVVVCEHSVFFALFCLPLQRFSTGKKK